MMNDEAGTIGSGTLIIGYGNPLRGDDGAGWFVAQQLSRQIDDARIRVMALHQLTPDLAEPLRAAQQAIFIDARADLTPGRVEIKEITATPSANTPSTHHLLPQDLLLIAQTLYGKAPQAFEVAIGANRFEHGEGLSEEVEKGVQEAVKRVEDMLDNAA